MSSPGGTEITSLETRVLAVAHSEDFMILSCVVSTQYSSVTDRQTDRQKDASAVAKTRLALRRIIKSMLGVYADHLNSQYIGPLTHSVWCVPALLWQSPACTPLDHATLLMHPHMLRKTSRRQQPRRTTKLFKSTSDDRWSWPTFWAWFSFQRQSADELVEAWHVSLVTSRQWREKNGRR